MAAVSSNERSSRYERYRSVDARAASGWSLQTLVQPAPLYGANGIRIGPDGRCWIAEFRGGSISAWDPESGRISLEVPLGGPIAGPDDLAFGADGSMYVTEFGEGRVDGLRSDGTYFVLVDDSPKANGITIGAGGRLFVDEFRAGGRLLEVDRRARNRTRVIAELEFPNALETGPDGRLYVSDVVAGVIYSVDPDDGVVRKELGDFSMPAAVKFDGRGRVVIAENGTGIVHAVDLATGEREILAELAPGLDNVCFDSAGRLYVSSAFLGDVTRFVGGRKDRSTDGGLNGPYGIDARRDGGFVIADQLRIVQLDRDGGTLSTIWEFLLPDRSFVVVDLASVSDFLFVVTGTGEVRRLDPAARAHDLVLADDVSAAAVTPYKDGVLVAHVNGTTTTLDPAGRIVGEARLDLAHVTGFAAWKSSIAACDADTGTVLVQDQHGTSVKLSGFAAPESVALGADGVFVAETERRQVTHVDLSRDTRTPIATGLPMGLPQPSPRSGRRAALVKAADGSLVVGCDGDGSVRRLCRESP